MKKKILVVLNLIIVVWLYSACSSDPGSLESDSRCELFAGEELSVVLHGIYPSDTTVKMYVKFKDEVIGLEDGRDDGLPWEYSVQIGEVESFGCDIFEGETYAGRLYCVLPLPPEYRNAAKQFIFRVNGCDEDLLSIPRLSLTTEKTAGSGGGSSSGSDKKLKMQFDELCGVAPWPACDTVYESWCICMGGWYECYGGEPSCD